MEAGPVFDAEAGSEKKRPAWAGQARVLVGLRRSCDVAGKVDAATLPGVAGLRQ